jgi:succinyl-CoA:acetate CoA-transferase
MMSSRVGPFADKRMPAEAAAALVASGSTVGMSGFTGSGYPKAVPLALAARIETEHAAGNPFQLRIWTGASTGPELDGALAKVDGIELRLPYNSDPIAREKINAGKMDYLDMHLSQVAPMAWQGFLGPLDTALIEVSGIRPDGSLIPSSSIGNNKTWLDQASQVILEVNHWQNPALEGMHDIYYGTALPPHRVPIPLVRPDDRIGEPYFRVDPDKVVAVVETDSPDRNAPFTPPDTAAIGIAGHLLEFFRHEVARGRLPASLLPLQSGVGNVANAVLTGLIDGPFDNMTAYTEVIQDGMLDLLASGRLRMASATAFSLSPEAAASVNKDMARYRETMILQQSSGDHPQARLSRDERADRGGHLRQRQLDPYHGVAHPERHRRIGRFRAQRLCFDLHDAIDGQGRQDFRDRAVCQPRRPYRAGRPGPRHRTGSCRSARPQSQAARKGHNRALRSPRIPGCSGRLFRTGAEKLLRSADANAAE